MDENSPFSSTLVAIKSKRKHFFFNPTYASRHSQKRLRPLLYRYVGELYEAERKKEIGEGDIRRRPRGSNRLAAKECKRK